MADLTGTALAANYVKTQPSTQFGTRTLQFLQIDMNQDVETDYLDSNSLYSQAVRALQSVAELYGIGQPNGNWFTAIVSADTLPYPDGSTPADGDTLTNLEDIIDEATGASCTVWNSVLNGGNIENNC